MSIRVGIRPHEYDRMTPSELNIHIEEFYKSREEDTKERAFLVYMGAKLPLYKKFPETFEKAFGFDAEAKKKEQTPEDMFAEAVRLNAALGGTVY